MPVLNPYLNFKGNTEEAFNFYRSVFGGDFSSVVRFKDTPESSRVPEKEKNMLMHIALPIGKGNMLMATDALESMGHNVTLGDNMSLSLHTESKEEADRLFNGLSQGGKVEVPLSKMFWGDYFGMFKDKFGVQWMISFREESK
jgi:PhnB protein